MNNIKVGLEWHLIKPDELGKIADESWLVVCWLAKINLITFIIIDCFRSFLSVGWIVKIWN